MVRKRLWLSVVLMFSIGVTFVMGCNQRDTGGRMAISGNVTFQGSALDHGTIEFKSTGDGPAALTGAMIKQGRYEVPATQGLPPGTYKVRISSAVEGASAPAPEMPGMPGEGGGEAKERIPAEYSSPDSEQRVTVTSAGPNKFDFDIP